MMHVGAPAFGCKRMVTLVRASSMDAKAAVAVSFHGNSLELFEAESSSLRGWRVLALCGRKQLEKLTYPRNSWSLRWVLG